MDKHDNLTDRIRSDLNAFGAGALARFEDNIERPRPSAEELREILADVALRGIDTAPRSQMSERSQKRVMWLAKFLVKALDVSTDPLEGE